MLRIGSPEAIVLARLILNGIGKMREAGDEERFGETRFVWTTGSWLIHTYLEKASPSARREMEEACKQQP